MILYIENLKDAIRKLLELINKLDKVAGYKINTQKLYTFLYNNNVKSERIYSIHCLIKKNKICRNNPT